MRTMVKQIRVNTRDEKVDISVDGNLKRKFLLRLLEVGAVSPSYEIVDLLREAIANIKRLYDAKRLYGLPGDFDVSDAKFNNLWGETLVALDNGSIGPLSPVAICLLHKAQFELNNLHYIDKILGKRDRSRG